MFIKEYFVLALVVVAFCHIGTCGGSSAEAFADIVEAAKSLQKVKDLVATAAKPEKTTVAKKSKGSKPTFADRVKRCSRGMAKAAKDAESAVDGDNAVVNKGHKRRRRCARVMRKAARSAVCLNPGEKSVHSKHNGRQKKHGVANTGNTVAKNDLLVQPEKSTVTKIDAAAKKVKKVKKCAQVVIRAAIDIERANLVGKSADKKKGDKRESKRVVRDPIKARPRFRSHALKTVQGKRVRFRAPNRKPASAKAVRNCAIVVRNQVIKAPKDSVCTRPRRKGASTKGAKVVANVVSKKE